MIQYDKKHKRGKLQWPLPNQIGKVILVSDIDAPSIIRAIETLREVAYES